MNSTNVPSNRDNPAVVVGQSIPTDKGLEMPPKTAKWGVSEKEVKEAENQNEIVISQVGDAKLNEDGTLVREDGMLEKKDGTTISMVNPKAYQALMAAKKQKAEMKAKANRKKEVQSGMEIG